MLGVSEGRVMIEWFIKCNLTLKVKNTRHSNGPQRAEKNNTDMFLNSCEK